VVRPFGIHNETKPSVWQSWSKRLIVCHQKFFLSPTHIFATLDDDLNGTGGSDNHIKSSGPRKADKEVHSLDAIADVLFRTTLMAKFRRRGEAQVPNVEKLLDGLLEAREEQKLTGFLVTADRCYGNFEMVQKLGTRGIGFMFIMPEHLLKCHPFVGQSYLITADII